MGSLLLLLLLSNRFVWQGKGGTLGSRGVSRIVFIILVTFRGRVAVEYSLFVTHHYLELESGIAKS